MTIGNTIQGSTVGLRYAKEKQLKTLVDSPEWLELEPNSYSSFGSTIATVQRAPITRDRQRRKGGVSDIDAAVNINVDLLQTNLNPFIEGFLFCKVKEKVTTKPIHPGTTDTTKILSEISVDGTNKKFKSPNNSTNKGLDRFSENQLVQTTGFGAGANNGVFKITAGTSSTEIVVDGSLVDEGASANHSISVVGYEFEAGKAQIGKNGSVAYLFINTSNPDVVEADLGLSPGEYIFIGGDGAANKFAKAENYGFARVKEITKVANTSISLVLDKTERPFAVDNGSGKKIRIFFGSDSRNGAEEKDIVRTSYQFERSVGKDPSITDNTANSMYQYVLGCVPSDLSISIPSTDKISADVNFYGMDSTEVKGDTARDAARGAGATTRDAHVEDIYNTSSNARSFRLIPLDKTDSSPKALFAFITEATININNSLSGNKAVSNIGAIDVSAGTFTVDCNVTAYFTDIAAITAVKGNTSVSLDASFYRDNKGFVLDIPLLTISDASLNISTEEAITIPLDNAAAKSDMGHTILYNYFPYLPNLANPQT